MAKATGVRWLKTQFEWVRSMKPNWPRNRNRNKKQETRNQCCETTALACHNAYVMWALRFNGQDVFNALTFGKSL